MILMEALEERRLMSHTFADGVLTAKGTNQPDYFEVRTDGPTLQLYDTGRWYDYKLSKVKKIVVTTKDGIDNIVLREVPANISCVVKAGDGNDNINGGAGKDKLYGGAGNDTIEGYLGSDKLYGAAGNDRIYSSSIGADPSVAGKDRVFGGAGNDAIYTNDGYRDIINGNSGRDTLEGDDRDEYEKVETVDLF